MPEFTAFDMDHKISILCGLVGKDVASVRSMVRKVDIREKSFDAWCSGGPVLIKSKYRERFLKFWEDFGIDLPPEIFSYSSQRFDEHVARYRSSWRLPGTPRKGGGSHKNRYIHRLIGVYQVFRPHAFNRDEVVLEAMEIQASDRGGVDVSFLTYDRPEAIYSGTANTAERYCFCLMSRVHERDPDLSSFRCLLFYAGDKLVDGAISGLMLRGLTEFPLCAAGIPFVAFKSSGASPLNDMSFVRLGSEQQKIWRVDDAGSIAVGDIKNQSGAIYAISRQLIEEMEKHGERGYGAANGHGRRPVLMTIGPSDLEGLFRFDWEKWRAALGGLGDAPDE